MFSRQLKQSPLHKLLFFLGVATQVFLVNADSRYAPVYTAFDDASWAVTSNKLSNQLGDKQRLYDNFIAGCEEAAKSSGIERDRHCEVDDEHRQMMNSRQPGSVYNYTEFGYTKIKAPKELFDVINNFYQENRHKAEVEWKSLNTYHNLWQTNPTIVHMNDRRTGGGPDLQTHVWDLARNVLEDWTQQTLSPVSLYGIRLYHNGSILAPHVDRMPLVISCIINVDQDVEEPWPLEVYGHDGKATNVTMEPGDMVLYESHSVIHGRPFPLKGNFYANVFIHFEPIDAYPGIDPSIHDSEDLPPYLIPGSYWVDEWRKNNEDGWKVQYSNPHEAAQKGDMRVLQRIAKISSSSLHQPDEGGWLPLHEAVRSGHADAVQFLLLNGGDHGHITKQGYSALYLARKYLTEEHPVTQLLVSVGATEVGPEL